MHSKGRIDTPSSIYSERTFLYISNANILLETFRVFLAHFMQYLF